MLNSLHFKIKSNVDIDKHRLLELFFKDWVDAICENEVQYVVERTPSLIFKNKNESCEIFKVNFEKQEDALAMRLRGVPEEFQHYLEIVN